MKRHVRAVALAGLALLALMTVVTAQAPLTLSGRVSSASTPIAGATVSAVAVSGGSTVASAVTGEDGAYALPVLAGVYDIHVTPPAGSGLGPAVAPGRGVYGNMTLDFVLVEAGGARLSGRVLDGAGNGVGAQKVDLSAPALPAVQTPTAADGSFALSAQPGTYQLGVHGYGSDAQTGAALPQYYTIWSSTPGLSLTGNLTRDLELPLKRVTVQVKAPGGTGVPNVTLTTNYPTNCALPLADLTTCGYSAYWWGGLTTDADGKATLWLLPTESADASHTYVITAAPPEGTPFATTAFPDIAITTQTDLTLTLSTANVFSGRVLDGAGNGVGAQKVDLSAPTLPAVQTPTAAGGSFALNVQPGAYQLGVHGYGSDAQPGAALPQYYTIWSSTPGLSLTENLTLDLALPLKRVTVQVQDPGGTGVPNVTLTTNYPTNCALPLAGLTTCGYSAYWWGGLTTDVDGKATLWLLPTESPDASHTYVITAVPPADSPYVTFAVSNIEVASAKSIVIVLPWLHNPPITEASLAPSPGPGGTYLGPVTVTLSATAFGGATITERNYELDGGGTKTYTGAFQVTGDGTHTLKYWSVDSDGVTEIPRTATFAITTTIEGLITTTQAACATGGITKPGICTSLQAKLNAAKAARDRGQPATAIHNLEAYLAELDAQRGKAVIERTYQLLRARTMVVIAGLR
jgi:hypothetical protein